MNQNLPKQSTILQQALLSTDDRDLLLEPFSEDIDILAAKRVSIEARGNLSEKPNAYACISWDDFFNDMSRMSFRSVYKKNKNDVWKLDRWRVRSLHFYLKNSMIINKIYQEAHAPTKILDVGCSSGYFKRILDGNSSPHDPFKSYYWGVDVRKDKIYEAVHDVVSPESSADGLMCPAIFIGHDVQFGLPFKNNSFHFSISSGLLNYLPLSTAEKLLSELFRVTSPSGSLMLTTSFRPEMKGFTGARPLSQVSQMIEQAGFAIIDKFGENLAHKHVHAHLSDADKNTYEKLCAMYPEDIVAAFFTPLCSQAATTLTYVCKK